MENRTTSYGQNAGSDPTFSQRSRQSSCSMLVTALFALMILAQSIYAQQSVLCGTSITASITLTEDVFCNNRAMFVENNAILDCNSHTITYAMTDPWASGVTMSGGTIKNCKIIRGTAEGGITQDPSAAIRIVSPGNTVSDNEITISAISATLYGIQIDSGNNLVSGNIVTASGNSNVHGVYLKGAGYTTLTGNDIRASGTGVKLANAASNRVERNAIKGTSVGIELVNDNTNNEISGNEVYSPNYGIRFDSPATRSNTFYDNLINATIQVSATNPSSVSKNNWNVTKRGGTNIVGGPYIGGNAWAQPDGKGLSQSCISDIDGFCSTPFSVTSADSDSLPLAMRRGDITAPVTSATALTVDGNPYVFGTWASRSISVTLACADPPGTEPTAPTGCKTIRFCTTAGLLCEPTTVYSRSYSITAEGATITCFQSEDNNGNLENITCKNAGIRTAVSASGESCTLDSDCPYGQVCGGCPKGLSSKCGGANDTRCNSLPTSCNVCVKQPGAMEGVCGSNGFIRCASDSDCKEVPCAGGVCGFVSSGICKPCSTSAECLKKTFDKAAPPGLPSPWFTIAFLAALTALFGAGLVYAIGRAFEVEAIKRAGYAEVAQGIASLILVALLFGTEIFEVTLIEQLERTSGAVTAAAYKPELFEAAMSYGQIRLNPFEVSYAFLRKLISCAENQYRFAHSDAIIYEWITNMQIQLVLKLPVIPTIRTPAEPLALVPSLSRSVAKAEYLADELTWLLVFLYAQIAALKFFETSMFTLFLPIGLILRAFPPTRGAGAVMTAIAIGLYVVYPLVFTILIVGTPTSVEGCAVVVPVDLSQLERSCPLAVGSTSGQLGQLQTAGAALEVDIPKVEAGANSLRYLAYVYMIVSLGATFIFIRSISSILGADISEIGRSMFRMM